MHYALELTVWCASFISQSARLWKRMDSHWLTLMKSGMWTNTGTLERYLKDFFVRKAKYLHTAIIQHIFNSIKHSLERLQLDYVDVLQRQCYFPCFWIWSDALERNSVHRFDNETPIEETMQALHDVVQAGYTRYIGMSSCWAWQCEFISYRVSLPTIRLTTIGLCSPRYAK